MFYVYAHTRKTDGAVFYIGKGSGSRAFVKKGRNRMWQSVYKKHGANVVILSRWETEDDAFDEERRLIQSIGIDNLCNMSFGGKGASGVEFSSSRKHKAKKHLLVVGKPYRDMAEVIARKNKKRIFTSCGRSFLGAENAIRWLESRGSIGATVSGLCAAARKGGFHKGVQFRYKGVEFVKKKKTNAKPVGNSDGEKYPSIRSAVEAMRSKGYSIDSSSICSAINGTSVTSCGKRWGYIINDEIVINDFERKTKLKKIERSDGKVFESLKEAAQETAPGVMSANKNISLAALGKTKTAYGFAWRYL